MRGPALIGSTLLALLVAASAVSAACPYPLGPFAADGRIVTWGWDGNVEDTEWAIVEATLIHGQKSFGSVVNAQGTLHFVYNAEVEFELPGGGESETHSIFHKAYSPRTGWDVPIDYLASEDPTVELPDGRNVQPSTTALGGDVWSVWEVSGAARFRPVGSYILLRGVTSQGFTPIQQVAYNESDAANKLPKIVAAGSSTYLAFQTNGWQGDPGEFRLVGRTWDGTTLGPIENISRGNDLWSDQVVSLATDGTRVFAVWTSQLTTQFAGDGDWMVKAAVRGASGAWGPEFNISRPNATTTSPSRSDAPTAEWHGGRLWVAWSTNDPALSARGDYEIVMAPFDPSAGSVGAIVTVNSPEFHGNDGFPAIYSWPRDGLLHILWSSLSSPDSIPTSGNDSDIFYRTFDGSAFSDIRLVSDPLDNGFDEVLPGFFTVGDALHAYFLSNICLPGCGHETDWREMTRLLVRPPRWYDGVQAQYTMASNFPEDSTTALHISFLFENGSAAPSEDYFVRFWDGSTAAAPAPEGAADLTFAYNASRISQLDASYCGRTLPSEDITPEPTRPPPRPSPVDGLVLPALVLAALASALAARRIRRS